MANGLAQGPGPAQLVNTIFFRVSHLPVPIWSQFMNWDGVYLSSRSPSPSIEHLARILLPFSPSLLRYSHSTASMFIVTAQWFSKSTTHSMHRFCEMEGHDCIDSPVSFPSVMTCMTHYFNIGWCWIKQLGFDCSLVLVYDRGLELTARSMIHYIAHAMVTKYGGQADSDGPLMWRRGVTGITGPIK